MIVAFNRRDYFRNRFNEANKHNYSTAIGAGIANNIDITDCLIDLDQLGAGNDDGDRGVRFETNVSDLTMTNDTINHADVWGVEMIGTITNARVSLARHAHALKSGKGSSAAC